MTAKSQLTALLPLVSDLSRELPEGERYRFGKIARKLENKKIKAPAQANRPPRWRAASYGA